MLHGGRRIAFADYREGDVAVLKNELAKMTAALTRRHRGASDRRKPPSPTRWQTCRTRSERRCTAIGLLVPAIEDATGTAERTRALRELEALVERVGWLVDDASSSWRRPTRGAIRVQAAPVDVERIVRDALRPAGRRARFARRGLPRSTWPPAPRSPGDAAWSAEALGNVLKNCPRAARAAGGTVRRASAREDAVALRLHVTDTGPGIAAEDLPHPVRALSARGEGMGRSFGIGLPLARSLTIAQGGTLRVGNDRATGGARFDFAFPKMVV